jgi:hypothetical protein
MARRDFLVTLAAATTSFDGTLRQRAGCVLLDLKGDCLRESVAGYHAALRLPALPRCTALIVPGVLEFSPAAARAIVTALHTGATVILESAAGFIAERDLRAHRAMLRDALDVHIDAPYQLWPRCVPYVDYSWPYPTKVRDFSSVVRLAPQAGAVIAAVDGLPVALRRRSGGGTLIFLGAPIGPALWSGDAEARAWLSVVLATAS